MNTNAASPFPFDPVVNIVGDRIEIHVELTDPGLARFIEGVPDVDRPALAANALRVAPKIAEATRRGAADGSPS